MNLIHHSIWNDQTGTFVAVSENTRSAGKKISSCSSAAGGDAIFGLKILAVSLMLACGASVQAQPTGGVVSAGSATIGGTAGNMKITQTTPNVAINWQSFGIQAGQSVQFVQPGSSSVALNRVTGSNPSSILGSLSANGKVFLVNPNGILFGQGASVNVGGLVASTMNITDANFMARNYQFSGAGTGTVQNLGTINAADGGYVALLGENVSNKGVISAKLGTVALAAGKVVTLDVAGDKLLNVTVDQGAVNALVENGGLIKADGGHVQMTAQAAGSLLSGAVNNTGVVQAQTVENVNGTIKLLGTTQSGSEDTPVTRADNTPLILTASNALTHKVPPAEAPEKTPYAVKHANVPPAEAPEKTPYAAKHPNVPPAEAPEKTPYAVKHAKVPPAEAPVKTPYAVTHTKVPPAEAPVKAPAVEAPARACYAVTPVKLPPTEAPVKTPPYTVPPVAVPPVAPPVVVVPPAAVPPVAGPYTPPVVPPVAVPPVVPPVPPVAVTPAVPPVVPPVVVVPPAAVPPVAGPSTPTRVPPAAIPPVAAPPAVTPVVLPVAVVPPAAVPPLAVAPVLTVPPPENASLFPPPVIQPVPPEPVAPGVLPSVVALFVEPPAALPPVTLLVEAPPAPPIVPPVTTPEVVPSAPTPPPYVPPVYVPRPERN